MISIKFSYYGHGTLICLCDDCKKKLIEALPPANNSEIPNSSDTISRAKAIDALTEYGNGRAVFISVGEAVIRIEQLPSAEPDVPDINVGDMISRQAAIDICNSAIDLWHGQLGEGALVAVKEKIEGVPSAQPERTCVNCGRTVNNGGWYADGRTRCPIEEHYALPKDGYCHLWEKRNVTDDDYPERRTDVSK